MRRFCDDRRIAYYGTYVGRSPPTRAAFGAQTNHYVRRRRSVRGAAGGPGPLATHEGRSREEQRGSRAPSPSGVGSESRCTVNPDVNAV